jgi:hypothetical protein
MKALLATPLHTGSADREFISGLLAAHGLYAGWICLEGQANISRARDTLAAQFLASDCTTMIFVDGDMGFGRRDVERLLAAPFPIVSGLCPRKTLNPRWACVPQPEELPAVPGHEDFRRVRRVGAAFLRIDRSALLQIIAAGSVGSYTLKDNLIHHFFPSGLLDGEFLSEDYYFCELAALAGIAVYVDTQIRLRHVGKQVYERRGADGAAR